MKSISSLTLATALLVGAAAFAQTPNPSDTNSNTDIMQNNAPANSTPRTLNPADSTIACPGFAPRVTTSVAIAFAASWNPFVSANVSAIATASPSSIPQPCACDGEEERPVFAHELDLLPQVAHDVCLELFRGIGSGHPVDAEAGRQAKE